MWPCRLHVVRVSAGGVQLAGVKRGRQDADAAALRRATHSTFISSRARASSCRKYQDTCLLRRAPSAGPSVACLATEVVTRSSTMALAPSAVGNAVPFSEYLVDWHASFVGGAPMGTALARRPFRSSFRDAPPRYDTFNKANFLSYRRDRCRRIANNLSVL